MRLPPAPRSPDPRGSPRGRSCAPASGPGLRGGPGDYPATRNGTPATSTRHAPPSRVLSTLVPRRGGGARGPTSTPVKGSNIKTPMSHVNARRDGGRRTSPNEQAPSSRRVPYSEDDICNMIFILIFKNKNIGDERPLFLLRLIDYIPLSVKRASEPSACRRHIRICVRNVRSAASCRISHVVVDGEHAPHTRHKTHAQMR